MDLARETGREQLVDLLEPRFERHGAAESQDYARMNAHLEELIERRRSTLAQSPKVTLRHLDVTVLLEDAGPDRAWFMIPEMRGGFAIEAVDGAIDTSSWIWPEEGSGQRHIITPEGAELVEEGFGLRQN
ncbi:MAG: hypothetical protein Q4G64_09485 [bacterium]|nr:hypothetical protein [bacterium]